MRCEMCHEGLLQAEEETSCKRGLASEETARLMAHAAVDMPASYVNGLTRPVAREGLGDEKREDDGGFGAHLQQTQRPGQRSK